MRSPRRLLALVLAAALLGAGGSSAQAQDAPADGAAETGEDLFGSYELESRGQGVQTYYEIEGLLPGGSPVLDFGMPEALARFGSGPTGYGLASLAFPGGIIANLGSLVEQGGGGSAEDVPPYPIKEEAFYPAGPTEAGAAQPGGPTQQVRTGELGVEVLASFPSVDANPAITVGSISTAARSAVEDGKAVSRSRVVVSDVVVLGGVLTIESVVTELVAAHDGSAGSTSGGTTASGVRFLGLAASLTEDGLVLEEAPPVEGPGEPLGGVLTPLVPGLGEALSPLQQALQDALGQATPQLDEVLATAGIDLDIAAPEEGVATTGAASRISSGLTLRLRYEGREQDALVDLIESIPPELKPNLGPVPNPIVFLGENHISGMSIAPASVMSLASPPFPEFVTDGPTDVGSDDAGGVVGGGDFDGPAFESPIPDLPEVAPGDGAGQDGGGFVPEDVASVFSGAVPALLVLLTMLGAPVFGIGSSRLADNVLAPVGTSCPLGLEQPPSTSRPT